MSQKTFDIGKIWKIRHGSALLWRSWDDEFLVFDTVSGDTHLLDRVSGEALRSLESFPSSIAALSHRLGSTLELEPNQDLAGHIANLILRLKDLGLIEPDSGEFSG
jgi:PqqD family protein of HPr-rel-A system